MFEAFTVEEYRRLIAAIDDDNYVGFRTKVITLDLSFKHLLFV
jgi:integrase/recombinase XerD